MTPTPYFDEYERQKNSNQIETSTSIDSRIPVIRWNDSFHSLSNQIKIEIKYIMIDGKQCLYDIVFTSDSLNIIQESTYVNIE